MPLWSMKELGEFWEGTCGGDLYGIMGRRWGIPVSTLAVTDLNAESELLRQVFPWFLLFRNIHLTCVWYHGRSRAGCDSSRSW